MTPFALDHPAVQEYLRRLDSATAHLPADERVDILEGIRSHLLTVMAEAETEADVHRALDALGSPEEIVGSSPPSPPPVVPAPIIVQQPPGRQSARGPLEVWAVLTVLLGGLVVGLLAAVLHLAEEVAAVGVAGAWIVGVVLLWVSSAWKAGEKLMGTFVVPGGLAGTWLGYILLVNVAGSSCVAMTTGGRGRQRMVEECSQGLPTWVGLLLLVIIVVGPIATSVYLLRAAGRRPAPRPTPSTA
jgi:hypothetical protein